MSKYSTELRYIINSGYDLGLKDYEIFSEEYRAKLNKKIIDHYYFHEIGFETVGRFKHYLNTTMNEIMPYYNKLLQSELLEINPLLSFERNISSTKGVESSIIEDIDNLNTKVSEVLGNQTLETSTLLDSNTTDVRNETQSKIGNNKQVGSSTKDKTKTNVNNVNETDVFYDTPSASLGDIETSNYATTVNKKIGDSASDDNENETNTENIEVDETVDNTLDSTNTSTSISESEGTSISNSKDDINETTTGKTDISKVGNINETNVVTENGFEIPLTDLLMKYRETFLNIDKLIINELKDLFMMVY